MTAWVTTTGLRKYLQGTVHSLMEGGFRVELVMDTNRRGPYPNFRKAMKLALAEGCDDFFMVCQDDIVVSENQQQYLIDFLPEDGVCSIYTAAKYTSPFRGWMKNPLEKGDDIYGACAMIWPRRLAKAFIRDDYAPQESTRTDVNVGNWCLENGVAYYIHSPSLCQHVGDESTLSPQGINRARMASEMVVNADEMHTVLN